MGVHGLWELLAPVGRRVSVETLAGKKLAIDASIWIIQFMKAMRDDKGDMVRSAHLIGFFRRICKLLFLRTKPVFVFDGATPALKRRTVIARRKQRENAQAKIRKTAEKLLLNHLKTLRLKELADEIENQRRKNDSKGKRVVKNATEASNDHREEDGRVMSGPNQEKLDEMLAASIAAEEENGLETEQASTSYAAMSDEEDDDDVDVVLPDITGEVDPALMDALPPDLLGQMKGRSTAKESKNQLAQKGKDKLVSDLEEKEAISRNHEQEKLDAMLAASIAAEEDGTTFNNASTSSAAVVSDEEDNDADEEIIIPEMQGIVDRDVLDSLPISMRLDLFAQMKERQMAENRQKYQEVQKAPEKFSDLQIQSYLKAVALRREINQVQKAASGIGAGGVRTSKIASEANREFIFSSSFTGNKDVLASTGVQRNKDGQNVGPENHSDSCGSFPSSSKSHMASERTPDKYSKAFDEGAKTFLNKKGRPRFSRHRAMGIRMTRDLQRNLDLIKEIEHDQAPSSESHSCGLVRNKSAEASDEGKGKQVDLNERNVPCMFENGSSIQISFEDDEEIDPNGDEELFTRLVAGSSLKVSSSEKIPSTTEPAETASDVDWEEGQVGSTFEDGKVGTNSLHDSSCIGDESDVEWEEGFSSNPKDKTFSTEASLNKRASKGLLEEDSELQEAIRRSLEDNKFDISSDRDEEKYTNDLNGEENILFSTSELTIDKQHTSPEDVGKSDPEAKDDVVKCSSADEKCKIQKNESWGGLEGSCAQILMEDPDENRNFLESELSSRSLLPSEPEHSNSNAADLLKVSSESNLLPSSVDEPIMAGPGISYQAFDEDAEAVLSHLTTGRGKLEAQLLETYVSTNDVNLGQTAEEFVFENNGAMQFDVTKSSLKEEMHKLNQERTELGNEQKKLERNAESVTSEMFTECQELLQMFGLPYIVAPMEAEAQCAYLEMANLVDGVVTDDSDVFLFGSQNVYKNIFDDRKYVETYFMKDIEKELGLSREKLIRMAMLLGSDYTEGISGIGIVNSVEVINAFPEEDGLQKFREWIESPDASILGRVDRRAGSTPRKRGSRGSTLDAGGTPAEDVKDLDSDFGRAQDLKQHFMDKHRNVSKNWHIPSSFPSEAVVSAYSTPQVDKSAEPFSWGKPNIFILRKLCWEKFGWNSPKADELLLPVLKEYEKHETQLRLEAYYTFNERFAKIRSKRIKKAVKGISEGQSSELMGDAVQSNPRKKKTGSRQHKQRSPSNIGEEDVVNDSNTSRRTAQGQRKRKGRAQTMNTEASVADNERASKRSHGNKRERSIGRSGTIKGSRTDIPATEISKGSSGHDSGDDKKLKARLEKPQGLQDVRRSGRNQKAVNYMEDSEDDESSKSFLRDDLFKTDGEETAGLQIQNPPITESTLVAGVSCAEDLAGDIWVDEAYGGPRTQDGDDVPLEDDYLRTGGGFCVEEDDGEAKADPEGSGNPSAESPLQTDDENRQIPNFVDEVDTGNNAAQSTSDEFGHSGMPSSSFNLHNIEGNNSEKSGILCNADVTEDSTRDDLLVSTGGGLSAMPFLRRKRKKT